MAPGLDCIAVRQYDASHGSHAHHHFQILLGLEGALELEIEGQGLRLGVGDGVVIAPDDRHDFEARDGARCLVLDSGDGAWRAVAGRKSSIGDALPLAQYLAKASELNRRHALRFGPALLLEAWLPARDTQNPRPRRAIDWQALSAWALTLSTLPTVPVLAAKVHLSVAQFNARCQDELGESPLRWIRMMRLVQARTWLDTGMGVAQTARRTGYRSASALTAALRRERL
jgi:AraC-like DNA-binding protein